MKNTFAFCEIKCIKQVNKYFDIFTFLENKNVFCF